MDNEKSIVAHAEQLGQTTEHSEFPLAGNDDALHGFQTDLDDLPAGYYRSSFFLGTMFAVVIGLTAAVGWVLSRSSSSGLDQLRNRTRPKYQLGIICLHLDTIYFTAAGGTHERSFWVRLLHYPFFAYSEMFPDEDGS